MLTIPWNPPAFAVRGISASICDLIAAPDNRSIHLYRFPSLGSEAILGPAACTTREEVGAAIRGSQMTSKSPSRERPSKVSVFVQPADFPRVQISASAKVPSPDRAATTAS
jgi:hypothetical protein